MIYRFGLFELDTAAAELLRDGRRVPLQEQPLAALVTLLERPGQVVEREELRQRLWPEDVHVDVDNGINTAVARLREALGDAASNPRFVATVPRRGYRFIAPVERRQSPVDTPETQAPEAGTGLPETVAPPAPNLVSRLWPLLIPLLVVVAAAGYRSWTGSEAPASTPPAAESSPIRVAVLPFTDLGGSAETSALGIGLTEELISRLGRLHPERLRVIARTSVMSYRGDVDLADLAEQLRVRYLLEGTVQQEDETVRVSAALVETAGQTRVWSAAYDRRLESLMAVEQEIAAAVARALAPELQIEATAVSDQAGRAHTRLLEGRFFLAQRTESGFRNALESFEAAVVEDPESAAAHAYLAAAWAYLALFDFTPRSEALPQAEEETARALALDPDLTESHLVDAAIRFYFHWDFAGAEAALERALRNNPSSVQTQLLAANIHTCLGRPQEAGVALTQALALDPLSPATHSEAAWLYFVNGEEEEARRSIGRALELQPEFLEAWDVAKWMRIVGREEGPAIEAFLRVVTLERLPVFEVEGLRSLAEEEGLAGLLRESLRAPEKRLQAPGQSPYNLALDYASLGETEKAVEALERAYESRETDLVALGVDPRLRSLHGETRFRALFERVGLPPELLEGGAG